MDNGDVKGTTNEQNNMIRLFHGIYGTDFGNVWNGQKALALTGTKIKANASKHAAVSYKRAGKMIEQLELEIEGLIKKRKMPTVRR